LKRNSKRKEIYLGKKITRQSNDSACKLKFNSFSDEYFNLSETEFSNVGVAVNRFHPEKQ